MGIANYTGKELTERMYRQIGKMMSEMRFWDKELFNNQCKNRESELHKFLALFGLEYHNEPTKFPGSDHMCDSWWDIAKMAESWKKGEKTIIVKGSE